MPWDTFHALEYYQFCSFFLSWAENGIKWLSEIPETQVSFESLPWALNCILDFSSNTFTKITLFTKIIFMYVNYVMGLKFNYEQEFLKIQ